MKNNTSGLLHTLDKTLSTLLETFPTLLEQSLNTSQIKEGSGGTPIDILGAVPSKDRAQVDYYYEYYKNLTPSNMSISRRGMQIIITPKNYQEGPQSYSADYDNTPNQPTLPESKQPVEYNKYFDSLIQYMKKDGMNIEPLPAIEIVEDLENAKNILGKTGHYSPTEYKIVLYVTGRHPKDILRSFCHEMIHHKQNIEGRLGGIVTTNTNEDESLAKIEQEAHYLGSMTLRKWEDTIWQELTTQ